MRSTCCTLAAQKGAKYRDSLINSLGVNSSGTATGKESKAAFPRGFMPGGAAVTHDFFGNSKAVDHFGGKEGI
jgi:hypothetical protein